VQSTIDATPHSASHDTAPEREPAADRCHVLSAALRTAGAPAAVALLLYGLLMFQLLAGYGFNPSGPIMIGDQFDGSRFWTATTIVQHGIGYDGQFFYYLAHDPLLRSVDPEAFLDHPAYRYGRVLYPALAWVGALGQPAALAWSMLGLNLLAVLVGTVASSYILSALGPAWSSGPRRWLALTFAFSPAVFLGTIADLAEPTSFAIIAVGLALHLAGRHRGAGLTLAIATLGRETSALVSLGFVLDALRERGWQRAAAYALPLALPIGWHLWLWHRLGALPAMQSPSNFGLPLSGPLYRAGVILGLRPSLIDEPVVASPWPELLIIGSSVAIILLGLARLIRRRDAFSLQFGLQAAAALCTTPLVWIGLGSYARVLGLLYLFFGFSFLWDRRVPPSPSPSLHTQG
jgi:hypothetical protein